MTILGLHHAQITVSQADEDAAREFYCDVLELEEIPKPEALAARGGFWVQVGTQQVHVSLEEGVQRAVTKAHLAYQVSDLEAMRARLERNGVLPLPSVPIPGYARFECRDPFGNRVEFIQAVE